jgi:hypothetical protein
VNSLSVARLPPVDDQGLCGGNVADAPSHRSYATGRATRRRLSPALYGLCLFPPPGSARPRRVGEQGLSRYDPVQHHALARQYGDDPVCSV